MTFLRRVLVSGAFIFSLAAAGAGYVHAQKVAPAKPVAEDLTSIKSSPAYAELQLKRTELLSDLESLLLDYTDDFPKIKELRITLLLIDRDIARISRVKTAEASKLTMALGKLMVRRVELETNLWNLQKTYQEGHPEVKRARKKIEIYETTINDILN